jgi:hypothetical protein
MYGRASFDGSVWRNVWHVLTGSWQVREKNDGIGICAGAERHRGEGKGIMDGDL